MSQPEPDPGFVQHLEWQLRTALRRRARFAPVEPRAAPPAGRRLRMVALALLSLTAGAAGVVASEQIVDARRTTRERELLLARADVEVASAERREQLLAERHERARLLGEAGVVSASELRDVELALREARVERERRALEREEIVAAGRAPDPGLGAPLVDGRDFASEHLELELRAAEARRAAREQDLARLAALAEHGRVSRAERDEAELALRTAHLETALLAERLELRAAFLRGARSREATVLQGLEAEVLHRRETLELRRRTLRGLVDRSGEGPAPDLALELERVEAEAELTALELELVRERLATVPVTSPR